MTTPIKADQETFKKYWNKKTTPQQAAALALGVHPEAMVRAEKILADNPKYPDISDKKTYTEDDANFLSAFRDHNLTLWAEFYNKGFYSYRGIQTLWGKVRVDFVHNLYGMRNDMQISVHPSFVDFLKTLASDAEGKWPDKWDHYKEHDRYAADLESFGLESIDCEDVALPLLLELNPKFFLQFKNCHEDVKKKEEMSSENWFFSQQYFSFLRKQFPHIDSFPHAHLISFFNEAKKLNLWQKDFRNYIQSLHDGGFVFPQRTYKALKHHGIDLKYSPDGWAVTFYKRWIEEGVWNLKESANLFLGTDPQNGRSFIGLAEQESRGPGRILTSCEEYFLLDADGKKTPTPLYAFKESISLEVFVRKQIAANKLRPAPSDGLREGLYFQPKEIVKFFLDFFPLNFQPEALLLALGLNEKPAHVLLPYSSSVANLEDTKIDAMQEIHWNLAQVFAKTYLNDMEYVNKASSKNISYGTYHEEIILPSGERKLIAQPSSPPDHLRVAIIGELRKLPKSFKQAKQELLENLQSGKIKCWGLKNNAGDMIEIPAGAWIDLDFFSDNHSSYASPTDHFRPGITKWHSLKFLREEILKIWPLTERAASSKSFSAPKSFEVHKKFYQQYLAANISLYLDGNLSKPWQAQDKEEPILMKAIAGGFDRNNFRKARKEVLATYPGSGKTNLSKADHEKLKAFLEKKKQVA